MKSLRNHLLALLIATAFSQTALAQDVPTADQPEYAGHNAAMVEVDGVPLFPLRGVSAFPAKQRAETIRQNIIAFAKDESASVDSLEIVKTTDADIIRGSTGDLVHIFNVDAELEQLQRELLAQVYLEKIKLSVTKFRHDRSPKVLWTNAGYSLLVIVVTGFLIWGVVGLFRWLDGLATRHVQRNIDKLASKSHHLISGAQVWGLFASFLRLLKILALILLVYFLLNTVLGLFPWTRPLALMLFSLVLDPLESMFNGFIGAIPDLAFLLVLFLIVRYILKIIRIFFQRVEKGYIKLDNFDNDWAMPTFKILRLLIVAFSIVIAYPYIPGSDSSAFKGISVFIGIIFSLGSSSFIAGMIAGLTMTYRGAFKEGDLVKIGDVTGVAIDIRLMITRVRTAKNEIVVIPNSTILNSNVINYSTMSRENKLILHTIVGIGYDTPWRQVEAMLLIAAERTDALLRDPPPFVLQKGLGDYAVNYELNAFCKKDVAMLQAYSDMHANIQDVFNEHGVQIMSPAYEADTAEPKIVPKENWYTAPARAPTKAAEDTGQ
jgi:small-conductance mechanosensitive channel